MRFMKPVSRRIVVAYGAVLGLVAGLGIVPCAFVAAEASAEDKVVQKEKTERGRFVSFQDGTLTIKANSGALLENKIPTNTTTLVWNDSEVLYKPADTTEALSQVKAETWVYFHVANENAVIRIGSRKGITIGTFVSFKDNRLLILGKNLGESFTKKYGNNVHFNKFRDDVPVYESIDGGEYKLVGTPGTVLGNVKEGTIITIHGEGDDNITLVQIGVPKKPTAEKAAPKDSDQASDKVPGKEAQKEKTVRGNFVSFEDRVLTLKYYKARGEFELIRNTIPENAKTFVWNHDEGGYQPVDMAEAMSRLKSLLAPVSGSHVETPEAMSWRKAAGMGLIVQIAPESVTIRIGENKTPFTGNFISFKDDFLYFRPSPQFQKSYGDVARFRMNESIPVFDSIDGNEYTWVGAPRTAFDNVKDGTSITVYHHYKTETDEFYLVLVGMKKK